MKTKHSSPAAMAYNLGKAHDYLRKVEKIFSELNIATAHEGMELLDLMEFCNRKVVEIKQTFFKPIESK